MTFHMTFFMASYAFVRMHNRSHFEVFIYDVEFKWLVVALENLFSTSI